MANSETSIALRVISDEAVTQVMTQSDIDTLNSDIDKYISAHKDTRHEINRLVFDSVANITEAEEAGRKLASKGFFSRLIGGITGSNAALQNKINSSRVASQYAAQQTLQKLAEQNVMTFDMIAAVNNKLNQSMLLVGEEFKRVYAGLAAFLNKNRSEMARMEARLQRVERNVNILNWQSTIEYLEWDGVSYNDLDNTSKIVCVARDFYEITKGEWTLSDLLLLKSAMSMVGIDVKGTLNYFDTLLEIAETPRLKDKLLGGCELKAIEDPSYVVFMGGMKKLEQLAGNEKYIVDTVAGYIGGNGQNEDGIRAKLTDKYLANQAGVNANASIEAYVLVLDLLYNLKQATDEDLLTVVTGSSLPAASSSSQHASSAQSPQEMLELGKKYLTGEGVEENPAKGIELIRQAADLGFADAIYVLGVCYSSGEGVEEDEEKSGLHFAKAFELYQKEAEQGDAHAMYMLGRCYYFGSGPGEDNTKAASWFRKAAENGNADAMYDLGECYYDGFGVDEDKTKAVSWYQRAAENGHADAMYELGECYYDGRGVEEDHDKSRAWYERAADLGSEDAIEKLEENGWR